MCNSILQTRKLKFRRVFFFPKVPQLLKEVTSLHTSPSRLNSPCPCPLLHKPSPWGDMVPEQACESLPPRREQQTAGIADVSRVKSAHSSDRALCFLLLWMAPPSPTELPNIEHRLAGGQLGSVLSGLSLKLLRLFARQTAG